MPARAPEPGGTPGLADSELDLVFFAATPAQVHQGLGAGLRSFIVDWEWRGKTDRQQGMDTEVNHASPEDLERLRELGAPRRFCRINRHGAWTREEIRIALERGATHIFLPMVEDPSEVEAVRAMIGDAAALGILVETRTAVDRVREIARAPVDAVYVGLNDLAISRRSPHLFDPLLDGTLERVREAFPEIPFGFGGVTVIGEGHPLPTTLLLAEMARLGSTFSFLRRSFRRDIEGREWSGELRRIAQAWRRLRGRRPGQVDEDRRRLAAVIEAAKRLSAPERARGGDRTW